MLAEENSTEYNGETIVLFERGTISVSQQAMNAQNAGAAAVIIYNNEDRLFQIDEPGQGITILVVSISQADGIQLAAAAIDGSINASLLVVRA